MADSIALTVSEVHAWHGRISGPGSAPGEPCESDLALLSAGERERCRRFVRQADRVRFAAAHAAMRRVLARYLAAGPAEVRFGRTPCCQCGSTEHGPPRIDWPPTDITCNLSGSDGHWLLAVTRGRPVGSDIEVPRDINVGQLASGCLTASEQQYLSGHSEDSRLREFYRCWTRKEAVLKACGVGLSSSLRELEVAPGLVGPVEVRHRCQAGPDLWIVQDLAAVPRPAGAYQPGEPAWADEPAGTPARLTPAAWLGAVAQPAADAGRVRLREAADAEPG
jgi:4'-phosphopantetheinyl transferase